MFALRQVASRQVEIADNPHLLGEGDVAGRAKLKQKIRIEECQRDKPVALCAQIAHIIAPVVRQRDFFGD